MGTRTESLRGRVQHAVLGTVMLALVLFAIPLAVAVAFLVRANALTELQRDATATAALVPDNVVEDGTRIELADTRGHSHLGLYSVNGHRVDGVGPGRSSLARKVADAGEHTGVEAGDLAVVVPVLSDSTPVGAVRAALPWSTLVIRVAEWWAGLTLLAVVVVLVTRRVARRVASRIAAPIEEMTSAARALGEGGFDIALPVWGMREADEAGTALQETARRLGVVVRRERQFTRDVSHQLRTPLTGLLTGLEAAHESTDPQVTRAAVATALERARHLQSTIDDLLVVRGDGGQGRRADPAVEARAAAERMLLGHVVEGRPLQIRIDDVADVACDPAVLRQVLDVLLDNAYRHGAGAVTLTVEQVHESVLIEVADEGEGLPDGVVAGTGLQLAADLAESAYGALVIRRRAPAPRIALLLPAVQRGSDSTA